MAIMVSLSTMNVILSFASALLKLLKLYDAETKRAKMKRMAKLRAG